MNDSKQRELKKVKSIAKNKNIQGNINISTAKGKRFVIENNYGKIHFGADDMDNFLIHKDEKRKKAFHNRFKNNKGYNNPKSGLYYSSRLLW